QHAQIENLDVEPRELAPQQPLEAHGVGIVIVHVHAEGPGVPEADDPYRRWSLRPDRTPDAIAFVVQPDFPRRIVLPRSRRWRQEGTKKRTPLVIAALRPKDVPVASR